MLLSRNNPQAYQASGHIRDLLCTQRSSNTLKAVALRTRAAALAWGHKSWECRSGGKQDKDSL